ncbi:MAG: hypothetical protein OJF50_000755 [Nitrospira sp.]|nr:hypothetical protein [Nitrospira sp.]
MGLHWFNALGAVMLFSYLFFNEVVCMNVWSESNLFLIPIAIVYLMVALMLSLWGGSKSQQTSLPHQHVLTPREASGAIR